MRTSGGAKPLCARQINSVERMLFLAQTIKNKLNALNALMSAKTALLKGHSTIKRYKVIQIIRL
jgi:hypothetical protein